MATTTDWAGNLVRLQDIASTDLTLVQWHRPPHGAWRGAYVLDADELQRVRRVVEHLDQLRRAALRDAAARPREHTEEARHLRDDLAGSPLHLETLFDDLLDR